MRPLTERQKKVVGGALLLALGLASGVAIAPDDPQRDDKLAELVEAAGSAVPDSHVDVSEYHRAVRAVRAGRSDLVDLLTSDVQPGATVVAEVNVPLGTRAATVEYVGSAVGRFETVSIAHVDKPGVPVAGLGKTADRTTIIVTSRNTAARPYRVVAFVHLAPSP